MLLNRTAASCAETNVDQNQQKRQKFYWRFELNFIRKCILSFSTVGMLFVRCFLLLLTPSVTSSQSVLPALPSPSSSCTHPRSPLWAPWGPWSGVSLLRWLRDLPVAASGQGCSYADCRWCVAPPLRCLVDILRWPRPLQGDPTRNASPR